MALTPVIMCGGLGTRLWPVSRDTMPKQFIPLFDGASTFQRTVKLLSDMTMIARAIVVTNENYRFTVQDRLAAIGVEAEIVLEPTRRDSAAAVALATELALAHDPQAVVVETCVRAARAAAQGHIVIIGVPPTHPATGYGYIRPGGEIGEGARKVEAFVEMPDAERAARCIVEGYLWNSGNFIFDAATICAKLERFAPDVLAPVAEAARGATTDLTFRRLDPEAFGRAQKISIDYAVMERTSRSAVVAGGFGWSDVDSWEAVWELSPKAEVGKAVLGRGHVLDGRNNLIRAEDQVVALIATRDAILVTPKSRDHDIKQMVSMLCARDEQAAAAHAEIHRPRGKYLSIDMGARYQVKSITVKPGGVLSLQKHYHRAEHWVVVRGTAEVTHDHGTIMVH